MSGDSESIALDLFVVARCGHRPTMARRLLQVAFVEFSGATRQIRTDDPLITNQFQSETAA